MFKKIVNSVRKALGLQRTNLNGTYKIEHYDKDGNLKGVYDEHNGIVDVGIELLLDYFFAAGTDGGGAWYIGLVDQSGFGSFANGDTMGSHNWSEFTGYSEGARPEWTADTVNARSITNAATVDFSITGTGTLVGIFIVDVATKSGTTGTLWSTAAFSSPLSVESTDTLKLTYTVSG